MTLQDANKLLAIAKANYSNAFKTITQREKVVLVHSWAFAFQDVPADVVLLAFMQLLTVSKWLPTIAEIREQCGVLHFDASTWYAFESEAEPQRIREAKAYIATATAHMRGDGAPMLELDTILRGQYMDGLGSGEMELPMLDGGEGA